MDPIIALLIGLVVGITLGVVIGALVGRARRDNQATDAAIDSDPIVLEARHAVVLAEIRAHEAEVRATLSAELAAVSATAEGLREQIGIQQNQFAEFMERSRAEQAVQSERERSESKVLQALTPVQETLRTMQKTVTDLETQRNLQHGQLSEQLKSATESEERLRSTAESLASALRNNGTRGVWGETQLRNV
eukprot:gene10404-12754_t